MDDFASALLQLIGKNRKRFDIAIGDGFLHGLRLRILVEPTVSVNAVLPVFQPCMTQDVFRITVIVLVNHRHLFAVVVDESVLTNNPAVATENVVLRHVAGNVIWSVFHPVFLP